MLIVFTINHILMTDQQINNFILENYLVMGEKTMAKAIGRSNCLVKGRMKKMGLVVPREIIEQRIIDSRYKKGQVPCNKGKKMDPELYQKIKHTFFKEGHTPINTLYDKAIRLRKYKKANYGPYYYIRISKKNWIPYHQYLWVEKYGNIPAGFIVVFKDKNTLNCVIENLEMISIEENMKRNTIHNYPEEIVKAVQTRSLLTRTINKVKKNGK